MKHRLILILILLTFLSSFIQSVSNISAIGDQFTLDGKSGIDDIQTAVIKAAANTHFNPVWIDCKTDNTNINKMLTTPYALHLEPDFEIFRFNMNSYLGIEKMADVIDYQQIYPIEASSHNGDITCLKNGGAEATEEHKLLISDGNLIKDQDETGVFIDTRDGKTYKLVHIGDQVWMAENLAWLPSVSPASRESKTKNHYYVYDYKGTDVLAAKATTNYSTYGVLYNWPSALSACPSGWHLPNDTEWKQLEMFLGMIQAETEGTLMRGTDEGTQMKNISGWAENGNGTNLCGFLGLPGGNRDYTGRFSNYGSIGSWWSSTVDLNDSEFAWYRYLRFNSPKIGRLINGKEIGYSVRCVRDNV